MLEAKVYYFFNHTNPWDGPQIIWRTNDELELMSAGRYIDKLFECMTVIGGVMHEIEPGLIPRDGETLYVNMDRLFKTNPTLFWKTMQVFQNFDTIMMSPDIIHEYLQELEDFCYAKVVSIE